MLEVAYLPTLPSLLSVPNQPFIHRDLSWLQFNDRVLAESRQATNPILERAKFLAISASNLDEFFMIRLASLGRQIQSVGRSDPNAARRLMRIRTSVLETVAKFTGKQFESLDLLAAELDTAGIHLVRHFTASDPASELGRALFHEQVLPKLGPPEEFSAGKVTQLENLQMAAVLGENGEYWLKIPRGIPSLLWAKDAASGAVFAYFLDDLLVAHLADSFGTRGAVGLVRVTRDGDFTVDLEEEDTESIPDVVRTGLGSRERGRPVRLQFHGDVTQQQLTALMNALRLVTGQVLPSPGSLCLQGLWILVNQLNEEAIAGSHLRHPPLVSSVPRPLRKPESIFERLRKDDFLLHHPYDSFESFVAWIQAACVDPQVTMIEQTVYRMDAVSPIIDALKSAAATKRVRVIIELRARFDELNNLRLADELRAAGVEVAFGFGKLKLHAKVALITRAEDGGERRYAHLSTGNYNAATARQYTDLAILTSNAEIGLDARAFFDKVFQGEVPTSFRQLVAAPGRLHRKLVTLIQAERAAAEAGHPARIVAKVNALVDEAVIEQLYLASGAGVRIDLIVRGACSLIPGVKGLSENIRVISVVDRLLEHSRLYYFGHTRALYLSSADWMPRNFFSRLELAFPILDPMVFKYIEEEIIPAYLADTVKAKELTSLGTWKKRTVRGAPGKKHALVRSQQRFEALAREEYRGTALE